MNKAQKAVLAGGLALSAGLTVWLCRSASSQDGPMQQVGPYEFIGSTDYILHPVPLLLLLIVVPGTAVAVWKLRSQSAG